MLRSALIVAGLAAPMLIAASGAANAICFRKCTAILPSGACSNHQEQCIQLEERVAKKMKPLRDGMTCKSQGLLCDYTGCKAVCGTPPKKKM
jgi:hypothetical protein